jgi:outer membrane lipoprotein carrier protein
VGSTEPSPAVSGTVTAPSPSAKVVASTSASGGGPAPTPSGKPDAGTPAPTSEPVASTNPSTPPPADPLPTPTAGSADEVAQEIDDVYKNTKTYKAHFEQKYHQHVQGTDKLSSGTVFCERPNKISFHYAPPNLNRIVSDGSILKVYVADDQQMYQNPVKNTEYPGALAFIMGSGIRRSFSFTFNDKLTHAADAKGPVLIGKPLTPTAAYDLVQFYVDKDKLSSKDTGAVIGVLIQDAQGNRNRFEFSQAEQPPSIDSAEFSFMPPAGTNIQQ